MTNAVSERQPTLGELVSELASQTAVLFKQELALAKLEMADKARLAGRDIAVMVAGGLAVTVGAIGLGAALILLLGLVLPLWAAALIVGAALIVVGGAVAYWAYRALTHIDPTPRETIETLKENRAWVTLEMAK